MGAHLVDFLTSSLQEILGQDRQKKAPCPAALVVAFRDFSYHKLFMEVFNHLGPFHVLDDCLVQFYPDNDASQKQANLIGSVIFSYQRKVASLPFHPNWLDEYLQIGDFGVNCAMSHHLLCDPSGLEEYRAKRARDKERSEKHSQSQRFIVDEVMSISKRKMVSDLSRFILDNFTSWPDEVTVKETVEEMIGIMYREMQGQYNLPRFPAQKVFHALCNKEQALLQQRGDDDAKTLNRYADLTISEEVTAHRLFWDDTSKMLRSILSSKLPKLMRRGLPELLKDEDAAVPDSKSFAGISFPHDPVLSMDIRLSAGNLRYDIQEQGHNLLSQVAGAFSAYYLGILEILQEQTLERLFREFSKKMDTESLCDHLNRILEESKVNID